MTIYKYDGFAYRQNEHPATSWIINFVASAEEILEWAGIPRRSEQNLIGFQRAYTPERVTKAKEFFTMPINQSPTALVIGIHPKVSEENNFVQLKFVEKDEDSPIRKCQLTINFDVTNLTLEKTIELVKEQLKHRIASDGNIEDAKDELDDTQIEESDLPEEVTEGDEIELGRSLLQELLIKLDDKEWCKKEFEALKDISKPATVIDGQHRIKGAQLCERKIPFSICAIYECSWQEQVYQFTVVNYTAKGIADQFITANAALSLTKKELDTLRERLDQTGVKIIEYELMKTVHFNSESPFYELVNLTEKNDPTKIGYKTMVRLAKTWYSASDSAFSQLLPNLYPDIKNSKAKQVRLEKWKNNDWANFFLDFWKVIHRNYKNQKSHVPGHYLWEVGYSNLIIAIVLFELQNAFLNNLSAQDEEFFIPKDKENPITELRNKLESRAQKFVQWIPADFFATKWALTSLNIGPGKIALNQALQNFVEKKGNYQYEKSALITGKTQG